MNNLTIVLLFYVLKLAKTEWGVTYKNKSIKQTASLRKTVGINPLSLLLLPKGRRQKGEGVCVVVPERVNNTTYFFVIFILYQYCHITAICYN